MVLLHTHTIVAVDVAPLQPLRGSSAFTTMSDFPTPKTAQEIPSLEPVVFDCNTLSQSERKHLLYLQSCDMQMENSDDPDDQQWKPLSVNNHRIAAIKRVNKKGETVHDHHLHVEVSWLNGEKTWVQEPAIHMDAPFVLIKYALDKKLLSHPDFKWVKEYADDKDHLVNMLHAHKSTMGP